MRHEIPGRPDPYAVSIAPQLYDLAFEQLAKPHGLTVEQAVNQLVAATVEAHTKAEATIRDFYRGHPDGYVHKQAGQETD